MKDKIILMNFTDIYKEQEFYRETDPIWLEFSHLTGCSCYCDEEAAGILRKEMRELPAEGIHFLDSGNYHYISLFWLEKTDRPFRLVLFDNHTDMQPPAFGGLLSCGGWAAEAMETVPALKEVILVGPDEEAFSQTDAKFREKVRFLSREKLAELSKEEILRFFSEIPGDLPVYLSVDKDVLCPEDASTSWSQGDMKLSELTEYLELLFENYDVPGMDVCGEAEPGTGSLCNDRANQALLELYRRSVFQ